MGADTVKIGNYGPWELVDKACSKLIDGGDPTSNNYVLYTHPRGESGGAHLQVAYARLQNRAQTDAVVAMGVRLNTGIWKAGQWVHATTTWTDDTTDFQDADATDAALETTTNDDGFLVSSGVLFNGISISVATASAGTPARVIEYSTGTSSWTTLANALSFDSEGANYGTGENVIVFAPPTDWARMASGHGTGVTVGQYGLRVRATTAPSTAGVATTMSIHRLYFPIEVLSDNNVYEIPLGSMYATLEPNGDALVAYFGVTNAQNLVTALVRARG